MITIPTKSVNIKFVHNLSYFRFGKNYFPVLLTVRALLARSPKRNKRKVVSGSRITLSFNPLARVTLAVGLPYLLVKRAYQRSSVRINVRVASFGEQWIKGFTEKCECNTGI